MSRAGRDPGSTADRVALALFGAWMLGRGVGFALAPVLTVEAPALLLVLSPGLPQLVVTSALLPPLVFWPLALGASLGQVALGYHVGRTWGQEALLKVSPRSGTLRRWRALVERGAALVVALVPGPITCTTAGAVGLRRRWFYPAMLFGVVLWVGGASLAGEAFTAPIRAGVRWVAVYVAPITALAAVGAWLRYRRPRGAREERAGPA